MKSPLTNIRHTASYQKSFGAFHSLGYVCPALKKIFVLFLAVVIISQTLVNVGIGVYYHFNKAYITQQLCENKNKPSMHCNGHCYLSKQLKKAEEGESKSTQIMKEKEEIISNSSAELPGPYFPVFSVTKINGFTSVLYVSDNATELLKPPTV